MKVQLFADPAYIGECIGEYREVVYEDIGGIYHGIPRMMMRTGGRDSGIKVGFLRDDGLVEVPLHNVFASRHMAEIFLGKCEEKMRVDIDDVPDPILGTTYRRVEPVVAESEYSSPGEATAVDSIKDGAMDTECRGPQTILFRFIAFRMSRWNMNVRRGRLRK